MKVSTITIFFSLAAVSTALVLDGSSLSSAILRRWNFRDLQSAPNGDRPVPNGSCCVAITNLAEDQCTINGQLGKCVPSNTAGCNDRLTCVPNNELKCDSSTLENGKPRCRRIDACNPN